MKRSARPRVARDRGESLIEVLVTIMVIGVAVPAIMGAVLMSVAASDQSRREVQAQALLGRWAETIARESTDARYTSCPTLAHYASAPFAPANIPSGFTTRVASIDYWVKGSGASPGSYTSSCAADAGLRRLRLRVTVPASLFPAFDVSLTIVLRRPCATC